MVCATAGYWPSACCLRCWRSVLSGFWRSRLASWDLLLIFANYRQSGEPLRPSDAPLSPLLLAFHDAIVGEEESGT